MVQKLSTFLSTSLVANALDSAEVSKIVQAETILLDSGTSGNYIKSLTGTAFNISAAAHALDATINIDSNHIVHRTGAQTVTNKTINLSNNTLVATLGQLSAAVSGDNVVGENAAQTLTNKTLTSPTITQPTITGPASLTDISTFGLRDVTTTTYETRLRSNNNLNALTADRTLTFDVRNADREIQLGGDIFLSGSFLTVGGDQLTFSTTGTTAVTLPTSGTLVSKDGNGDFSAGTITATFVGNLTGQISDISNLTTDSLAEGSSNLYYTTARVNSAFDTRFLTKDTDSLAEGTSNLYYTTTRANAAIDARVTKTFVDNLNINADQVDGLEASQFLRSDTSDTMTAGRLSFHTSNVQAPTASDATTGARLVLYPLGSGRDYSIGIEANTMWFNTDDNYKWYADGSLKFEWDNTAGQLEIGGNKVWHAGNDGAGSGLDADTLDGQQGTYYRIDVYDASGTLLN